MTHPLLSFLSIGLICYVFGVCTGIGIGLLIASNWLRKAEQK